jgi:hypothetical protein
MDLVEQEIHEQGVVEAAMASEVLLNESMALMAGSAGSAGKAIPSGRLGGNGTLRARLALI